VQLLARSGGNCQAKGRRPFPAKAADVGEAGLYVDEFVEISSDAGRRAYWDEAVNRWRDPKTGRFASVRNVAAAELEGSIRDINPYREISPAGSTFNCTNCVIAADASLAGYPTCAMPGNLVSADDFLHNLPPATAMTPDRIVREMQQAGPGARGIVMAFPSVGFGHVWNVINYKGYVFFPDAQEGALRSLQYFDRFDQAYLIHMN
jgi:hypothetical protein